MGAIAHSEFREEMTAVIGERVNITPTRLNRWINFGYLDVTGSVEFDELEVETDIALNVNEYEEAIPADVRSVMGIRGDGGLLQWIPKYEWQRIFGGTGVPKKWTRIGGFIKFTPVPTVTTNLVALFKKEPARLTADTDVTAIPQTWDLAVHYMAVSHAFFAANDSSEGTVWFNRAAAYMKTRADEERRNMFESALGGTRPISIEKLSALSGSANAYQG